MFRNDYEVSIAIQHAFVRHWVKQITVSHLTNLIRGRPTTNFVYKSDEMNVFVGLFSHN